MEIINISEYQEFFDEYNDATLAGRNLNDIDLNDRIKFINYIANKQFEQVGTDYHIYDDYDIYDNDCRFKVNWQFDNDDEVVNIENIVDDFFTFSVTRKNEYSQRNIDKKESYSCKVYPIKLLNSAVNRAIIWIYRSLVGNRYNISPEFYYYVYDNVLYDNDTFKWKLKSGQIVENFDCDIMDDEVEFEEFLDANGIIRDDEPIYFERNIPTINELFNLTLNNNLEFIKNI